MDQPVAVAVRPLQAGESGVGRVCSGLRSRDVLSPLRLEAGHRARFRPPHLLPACRAGRAVTGVLPLTHVKSLLFGSSLISNAFGVHGGPDRRRHGEPARARRGGSATDGGAAGSRCSKCAASPTSRADWPTRSGLYDTFRKPLDPTVEAQPQSCPPQAARDDPQGQAESVAVADRYRYRPALSHLCRKRPQPRHAGFRRNLISASSGKNFRNRPTSSR